jgi:hypothetical protein
LYNSSVNVKRNLFILTTKCLITFSVNLLLLFKKKKGFTLLEVKHPLVKKALHS